MRRMPGVRALVHGPSMAPTLRSGDALLVRRAGRGPARATSSSPVPQPAGSARGQAGGPRAEDGGWWLRRRQPVRHRRLAAYGVADVDRPGVLRYWPRPALLLRAATPRLRMPGDPRIARRVRPTAHHRPAHRVPIVARSRQCRHRDHPFDPPIRLRPAPGRQDGRPLHRAAADPRGSVARLHARASPGSARPSPPTRSWSHDYTWVGNTVAVVTDGSAVLGLGNIGPRAAMPVMEGKAVLFKQFGDVDAVPICLDTQDPEEIIAIVTALAPVVRRHQPRGHLRAALLRDRAPARRALLDIPVFHDDQHGTAIVVLAALRNAAALLGRQLGRPAGRDQRRRRGRRRGDQDADRRRRRAATSSSATRRGIVHAGRADLNPGEVRAGRDDQRRAASPAAIAEALIGADVLIGVSGGHDRRGGAGRRWRPAASIFALANPTPEVHPDVAPRYAAVVATGRSDFPNQINNVLAFPGIFRGALDVRATRITEGMKVAAAEAIADVVADDLRADAIVPSPLDPRVAPAVAAAVAPPPAATASPAPTASRARSVARRDWQPGRSPCERPGRRVAGAAPAP